MLSLNSVAQLGILFERSSSTPFRSNTRIINYVHLSKCIVETKQLYARIAFKCRKLYVVLHIFY